LILKATLNEPASLMDLYLLEPDYYTIEWHRPLLDDVTQIGIWVEGGILTDYDGVYELPVQAIKLLRQHSLVVPQEFTA
jgi:hypothetical protein